jgi:hypothetical protein
MLALDSVTFVAAMTIVAAVRFERTCRIRERGVAMRAKLWLGRARVLGG